MLPAFMLLGAMLAGPPPAQPPVSEPEAQVQVRHRPLKPDSITGDHVSLPITFVSGLPTIEVTVNGKGPFRVGVDTGAMGGLHMTDRLAGALGLAPVGEALASDPSGRNPIAIKLYRLDRVALGGVEIRGWMASAAPVRAGKLESLDGIIGLGDLDSYIVTIDYSGGRFAIDRGTLPEPDGMHVFSYRDPIPVVPVTIEGHTIAAHLDTGNIGLPLIVPDSFATGLADRAKARPAGQAHTVSNVIDMFAMPVEGAVQVGAASLHVTEIGFPSVIAMANIGSRALDHMVVRLDPANKRISLISLDEVTTAAARH